MVEIVEDVEVIVGVVGVVVVVVDEHEHDVKAGKGPAVGSDSVVVDEMVVIVGVTVVTVGVTVVIVGDDRHVLGVEEDEVATLTASWLAPTRSVAGAAGTPRSTVPMPRLAPIESARNVFIVLHLGGRGCLPPSAKGVPRG